MTPPDDGAVPTPVQPLTDAERAAATARVQGTAMPQQPVTGAVTPPDVQTVSSPGTAEAPPVAAPPPSPTDSQVVNAVADEPPAAEVAVPDDPSNVVALADRFDVAEVENWLHGTVEFKGDTLGIRLPTRQALAAFSLASSKYVSLQVKNDLTGLFIARHLSPESYGRVFSRLMDPDEDDYDVETVGELFNIIVMAAVDADKADDAG